MFPVVDLKPVVHAQLIQLSGVGNVDQVKCIRVMIACDEILPELSEEGRFRPFVRHDRIDTGKINGSVDIKDPGIKPGMPQRVQISAPAAHGFTGNAPVSAVRNRPEARIHLPDEVFIQHIRVDVFPPAHLIGMGIIGKNEDTGRNGSLRDPLVQKLRHSVDDK